MVSLAEERCFIEKGLDFNLSKDSTYYLIESSWIKNYKQFLKITANFDSKPPGKVDNSKLLNDKNRFLSCRIPNMDYVVLPEKLWKFIIDKSLPPFFFAFILLFFI